MIITIAEVTINEHKCNKTDLIVIFSHVFGVYRLYIE